MRAALEEADEQVEALRRENHSLAQELKDATDQLNEGGKGVHEVAKAKRRLELEKEELQMALEDAESALEAEESKVLRAQVINWRERKLLAFPAMVGKGFRKSDSMGNTLP
jgi:capsule polysaccharide export protein KpsE/RkpR